MDTAVTRDLTTLGLVSDGPAVRGPVVSFTVVGSPVPAGSKSVGHRRDGTPFLRPAPNGSQHRDWRLRVADAASEAMDGRPLLDGPLVLEVAVFRPRPKGHYRRDGSLSAEGERCPYPATRPDLTKLVRGIEDAILGVVFREDSQVVVQRNAKLWGEPARAVVTVARKR